jgi:hypothetical protein
MKRFFSFVLAMALTFPALYSQVVQTWTEDFDNTVSFVATPSGSWVSNSIYYLPGSSTTNPKSYLGITPAYPGHTAILETPVYNCEDYDYVILKFNHICKISPKDITRIEYRFDIGSAMSDWEPVPPECYLGSAANYALKGFSAASYPQWMANDSTAFPTQSWWEEECFDLKGFANGFQVQFRFVIEHGTTLGTHVSYGWLIDNFQLLAAKHQLYPPIVEFISPFVKDTIYNAGPCEIRAKVKAETNAPVKVPLLKYTAIHNGASIEDSVVMTMIEGDSLWKANIPPFVAGTKVIYSITGQDTMGNATTAMSAYLIIKGQQETIIVADGGTSSSSSAFVFGYGYSRSMSLFSATELGATPRKITTIALRVSTAANGSFPMKVWLKTVPASKTTWSSTTDNVEWTLLTQNATLLYDDNFYFDKTGWTDIPLSNIFSYNGTDNLVIMFEQNCGSTSCSGAGYMTTYPSFYYSSSPTSTLWRKNSDNNPPTASTSLSILSERPNLRIEVISAVDSHSVAISSIDINDTIIVSQNSNIPVIGVIKNKGDFDLDSVNVFCSVNGSTPTSKTIYPKPALAWDFTYKDTLTRYSPKVNGHDTITIWVSMPNGHADNIVVDDTLKKIIYGSSDIQLRFVGYPDDTVYNTGPYVITAEIFSLSGAALTPSLFVKTIFGGTTSYDTLAMVNTLGNLWQTTIPRKVFGSDVTYTIKMTDVMLTNMVIENKYFIKRIECDESGASEGYVILQDGSSSEEYYPFRHNYGYSRSMSLFPAAEIDNRAKGFISKIALRVSVAGDTVFPMKVWLKTVPASKTTWDATTDNIEWNVLTQDATLVYDTNFHFATTGWVDIPLSVPYLYTHTDNLVVMFEQNCGAASCTGGGYMSTYSKYYHSSTATDKYWRKNSDNNLPSISTDLYIENNRPDLRISVVPLCVDTHSVALLSIDSPQSTGVIAAVEKPVRVTIQNKGRQNLTSCTLNWTLNGVSNPSVVYSGNLPEEFTDTITIGSYFPVADKYDTIDVWVSMPNGKLDTTTIDDTLTIAPLGCTAPLSGSVTVGTAGSFASVNEVFNIIRHCGVTGDVTLELKGTFSENIDLTEIEQEMRGYRLSITSADNHADSAVIQPLSGDGITISNMRNLTLKAITVKIASDSNAALLFTDACTNIVVRDCKLLVDTTSSKTTSAPVYKAEKTAVADSIFFIHNLLDGGCSGFSFCGGVGTGTAQYATHVVFDSNTVSNSYSYGIDPYYVDFTSCSYNTVISRTTNVSDQWLALVMYYCNGAVIGNRIIQRSTSIGQAGGIVAQYYNKYPALPTLGKGLIANNETILNMEASGIYVEASNAEILHNSIYISGNEIAGGIYIVNSSSNDLDIKNNNIVALSSSAYPIYFDVTGNVNLYNIDYNNVYAPLNIGYYGEDITDMTAWSQVITTDIHSIKRLPNFLDPSINLKPADYYGLFCAGTTSVNEDIEKTPRAATSIMGAYTIPTTEQDMMITQIKSWNTNVIHNQTVQVDIEVINTGTTPITDAMIGWSLNGTTQSPVAWSPTSSLGFFQQATIPVGSFSATNADTFQVVIWIDSLNGTLDTIAWNNTVSAEATVVALAEFVPPFVGDTIGYLSFEVNAKISTVTGAPLTPPMLMLKTLVRNSYLIYDSIAMVLDDDIWKVTIPQQYYNSKVIYSLTVSDNMGNTVILTDSTYIKYTETGKIDSYIIGAGTVDNFQTPITMLFKYGWTRQIYLYREISQNLSLKGVVVDKIAWQSISATTVCSNQTCYMRAIDDSVETFGYIDPLVSGIPPVWTGTINIAPGWVEITLDTPFFLPAHKNLEIIWEHRSGSFPGDSHKWAHTTTQHQMTIRDYSDGSFPTSSGYLEYDRPNLKITTSALDLYQGNNLALAAFLAPINRVDSLCLPDYSPVRVALQNLGKTNYDFSQNNVTLRLEVVNPDQTTDSASISIKTGILEAGKIDTLVLLSALPVMDAGKYVLKAWLESPIDNMPYDDTITYTYTSQKIGLPVQEDFSGTVLPAQFLTFPILGSDVWAPYSDSTSKILPPAGNGMLRFVGTHGAIAQLTTRQLDLRGTVDPKMDFWFYHDSTADKLDNSFTDVNIVADGVAVTVLTLFRRDTTHGWKQYSVDLKPYTNAQCVLIQFESINKFGTQSAQYLGFISIISTSDISVTSLLITPEITACDLINKKVYVILSATANQSIDFSLYNTSLAIEIGSQTLDIPLKDTVQGNSSDTILVATNIDLTGVSNLRAYLTSPVDNYALNDTAKLTLDLRPSFSVTVSSTTSGKDCLKIGSEVQQKVVLINTGNMDILGIKLILHISGSIPSSEQTIIEATTLDLPIGDTLTYYLTSTYTVPPEASYQVLAIASMECDSARVNSSHAIDECADIHDLAIKELINPPKGQKDAIGSTNNIVVLIKNESDLNTYQDVLITAAIEDKDGQIIASWQESIPTIVPSETLPFLFTEEYTVPNDSVYFIRIYLDKVDNYPETDTLIDRRETESVGIYTVGEVRGFSLGQNIPNPTNVTTRIDYAIPEAGEVIFHLHSISGQLLYSKTVKSTSGKQSIELNITTLPAGIYFYSIEYKSQRLIKRMSVQR